MVASERMKTATAVRVDPDMTVRMSVRRCINLDFHLPPNPQTIRGVLRDPKANPPCRTFTNRQASTQVWFPQVTFRLQREYSRWNLNDLLTAKGIDCEVFIPRHLRNGDEHRSEAGYQTRPFLLLEFFDNEDYECRTPEEWLALGDVEGSPDRQPVPATALLPKHHQTPDENHPFVEYSWCLVGVLDYNEKKRQYLVQEVQDKDGNPILNPQQWKKVNASQGGPKHWIPRIRLCFHGEDPRVFVERVSFAQRFREDVENRILCDLSVDHMPLWGGNPRLSPETIEKIKKCANSAPGLRLDIIKKHEKDLEQEVELEHARCMNKITFDFVVKSNPELFSSITLPQEDPKAAPDQGARVTTSSGFSSLSAIITDIRLHSPSSPFLCISAAGELLLCGVSCHERRIAADMRQK
ncbi:Dynein heavy chain 1, axonemal [Oryzias melastigma]|uniref:Dynein heavy chain 1, axonemal n=1 Tax=Oryzias melastigma TaxID=30732 RepID=A0A834BZE1_ORYME|nr:Dynein heavy chain 1, axonemal [Oryzias melastigma]